MSFNSLIDDAGAADAARAARLLAETTLNDPRSSDEARAKAKRVLDLSLEELVQRIRSSRRRKRTDGKRAPGTGKDVPKPAEEDLVEREWQSIFSNPVRADKALAQAGKYYRFKIEHVDEIPDLYVVSERDDSSPQPHFSVLATVKSFYQAELTRLHDLRLAVHSKGMKQADGSSWVVLYDSASSVNPAASPLEALNALGLYQLAIESAQVKRKP